MVKEKKIKKDRHEGENRRNPSHKVHLILLCIFFCVYAFLILFPYAWILNNSLKDMDLYLTNKSSLATNPVWSNYLTLFKLEDFSFFDMIKNSLILCLMCPTLGCLSATTAGYFMAKYDFKLKGLFNFLYLLPMVVSICGTTVSTYNLLNDLHLLFGVNGLIGLMVMSCGGVGMNFLLIQSLFRSVSDTYIEAAEIDGAGYFTIFFRIMLPQAMGLISTLWIMGFIGSWNDYMSPMLYVDNTGKFFPTVATGVWYIDEAVKGRGSGAGSALFNNYPAGYASLVVSVIPMVILFLCFQGRIMKLSLGDGIKE